MNKALFGSCGLKFGADVGWLAQARCVFWLGIWMHAWRSYHSSKESFLISNPVICAINQSPDELIIIMKKKNKGCR
jgi:hypothetical protein